MIYIRIISSYHDGFFAVKLIAFNNSMHKIYKRIILLNIIKGTAQNWLLVSGYTYRKRKNTVAHIFFF